MTVGIVCLIAVPARAADYGAKSNGNWSSSTTWTPNGGPPGSGDNADIGSTYPSGAAATATVMLTQNQQANFLVLGYGTGTSGTLNLGNFNLTASALYLGFDGGTGAITRGTGSLDVGLLQLWSGNLMMNANDRTEVLILRDGSSVTTAATANVSDGVRVRSGSTLTLGADLYAGALFNGYSIELSGANSTLNAQGHKITTPDLSIGWGGSDVVHFLNRGDLDVNNLFVANQALNLTATDRVRDYYRLANGSTTLAPGVSMYGLLLYDRSTATTTAVGNMTGDILVESGSTLTLGADLNVTSAVDVYGDNSTLDAQGRRITAFSLYFGGGGTNVRLLNRGDLALTSLLVANQNFNLTATDQVAEFHLSNAGTSLGVGVTIPVLSLQDGATATTSAVGNITGEVNVESGSTLTLGADLSVGYVSVSGVNSTINAQGHKITADSLLLGWEGGNLQLQNRGALAVTNVLSVENQNLNLGAADQVARFQLVNGSSHLGAIAGIQSLYLANGSTATTAAAGNLTGNVDVIGSTLTLGADLSVSGLVDVGGDNSTLDTQFHKITAFTLRLVQEGGTRFLNKGVLDVTNLLLAGQAMDLSAADRVVNLDLRFAGGLGSTASTAVTANVTGNVNVYASTLTLGADLAVTGAVDVGQDNSTLDAQGHNITANRLILQYSSADPSTPNIRLLNDGAITVRDYMFLLGGVHAELHDGNDSAQGLMLSVGADLRIKSAATGFTLIGTTADDLLFFGDSTLSLELNGSQPGWVFRWANPDGGNHIADLNALIGQDSIVFSVINGGEYNMVSQNGYTYIVQSVPEPSSLVPVTLTLIGIIVWRPQRRPDTAPAHGLRAEAAVLA